MAKLIKSIKAIVKGTAELAGDVAELSLELTQDAINGTKYVVSKKEDVYKASVAAAGMTVGVVKGVTAIATDTTVEELEEGIEKYSNMSKSEVYLNLNKTSTRTTYSFLEDED